MGALQNLEKGDVLAALNDVKTWVEGREAVIAAKFPAFATLEKKLEADGENVVAQAVEKGAQDVMSGGFSTASFVAAAKDVFEIAVAKGIPLLLTDVFMLINAKASELQASTQAAS